MSANTAAPLLLPYDFTALEPVIGERTLRLHAQLAAGYRDNFPPALSQVSQAETPPAMREALRNESFQGGGFILHTVYFTNMAPQGTGGAPGEATRTALREAFASENEFKRIFQLAAKAIQGPGWSALCWLQPLHRLLLLGIEKHNMSVIPGVIPILALDVWEHAYYIDYGTDRAAYVDAWWALINWNDVEQRLQAAMMGTIPVA